jgi:hypothetical protein
MADDITLFFGKMGVGHDGRLSGCELVVLLTLPEIPTCSALTNKSIGALCAK